MAKKVTKKVTPKQAPKNVKVQKSSFDDHIDTALVALIKAPCRDNVEETVVAAVIARLNKMQDLHR